MTDISHLPLDHRFTLGPEISAEQQAFLDAHGFLVFGEVASPEEVALILSELDRINEAWRAEDRQWVNGIPVFWGQDPSGERWVTRFTFTSTFSDPIRDFVRDARFDPVRRLIGDDARIGDDEKDGVVVNRYWRGPGSGRPRLGWHTDGLRDIFYGRMPQQMLNVGLHLDACPAENGGLRLIPGTHTQGFSDTCFRKLYFVSHDEDPNEIAVETRAGDLTVHDGRLWHRVAMSDRIGPESLRRSMYVPYLTGPREPKGPDSPTPLYHHLGRSMRWLRQRFPVG
ncbi:MAG: phytanoyl-CoA dioxygenase family protein [Alphaproteobacteria bacterium]|nr:phytanoyl-CoA dioxygenase family protein [Alphaproteobacteria bacterium]